MTEIAKEDYDIIRSKLVKKQDAQRLRVTFSPLENNRELIVFWPVNDDRLMEECLRFLDEYGSSTGASGQTWVDDPVASDEVYPGKWRVVQNYMSQIDKPPGVYQVLREGLLRELPATEVTDTEARLMKHSVDPQNGTQTVVRFWQGIDPSYDEGLIVARKNVVSRTNITVRGQTYTGTFAVSDVYAEPVAADGAIKIVEVLTEILSVSAYTDLSAMYPLLQQENEILRLFGWDSGIGDYVVATFTNLNPADHETIAGISNAFMLSSVITSTGVSTPSGFSYADRKFTTQKDNTAHLVVLLKMATWVNITGSGGTRLPINKRKISLSNVEGLDAKQTEVALGIPLVDIETVRDNMDSSDSGFAIDSVSIADNGDGSGTIHKSQSKLNSSTSQYRHQFVPAYGTQEETEIYLWKNISLADKDAIYTNCITNKANMAAATPAAPANHKLRHINITENGNNSWNVQRITWYPLVGSSDWTGGGNGEFYEEYTVPKFRITSGEKQVRKFRFHVWTLQTTSKTAADNWLDPVSGPGHNYKSINDVNITASKTPVKTQLLFAGKGRYRAIATYGSCTDWLNERVSGNAGAYDDLGVKTAT